MATPAPRIYAAGEREAGVTCPHCQAEIVRREIVAICSRCGATHHEGCWNRNGCGSYDCAPASRDVQELSPDAIRVTFDQLDSAPLSASVPGVRVVSYPANFDLEPPALPRRMGGCTIAGFVTALLGIPLFGIVTGPIAMLLGVIALVARRPRQRGAVLASLAILVGLADFVGWTLYLLPKHVAIGHQGMLANEFELDADDFKDQPGPISRALRANVLIEVESTALHNFMGRGIGSGVILDIRDGAALIVTNRHVVDPDFHEHAEQQEQNPGLPKSKVTVKMVGQPKMPGTVLWMAPFGVDLALLNVPATVKDISQACWDAKPKLQIGSSVFAVGNPHGLAWSHSAGTISQIRKITLGAREVKVIQTTAAINPGNSGGGLYDADGRLIGINTWTQDKQFAEGLGFAISFQGLFDLIPESFHLPPSRAAE